MLQGHLTNTKQSRVNSDAAQVLASSPKDVLKSTVFSCRQKAASDCSSLTKDGREFQARAAATGHARSPRVLCHVAGMISVDVAADRRWLQQLRLVVRGKVSTRYRGAVPWRHRKARTQSRNFILSGTLNPWSSQSNEWCVLTFSPRIPAVQQHYVMWLHVHLFGLRYADVWTVCC